MKVISQRLSAPAMIVACVSLVVALGGVSYAAGVLAKNSVGTAQLKKKAVTGPKIKKNAVTGVKVKDGSLLAADFKAGQIAAGPQGPKGDVGAQGPKGAPGGIVASKTTIKGSYGLSFYADAPGQAGVTAVSFGAVLPSAPSAPRTNFIKLGQGPTGDCPGSPTDPQAAPDNLCLYESLASNIEDGATMLRASSMAPDAADRYGVLLRRSSVGTGAASSVGTWAVTAP